MRVEGEAASAWSAVRLDSLQSIEGGPLVMADSDTGEVSWKDRAGELRQVRLGPRAIRLIEVRR